MEQRHGFQVAVCVASLLAHSANHPCSTSSPPHSLTPLVAPAPQPMTTLNCHKHARFMEFGRTLAPNPPHLCRRCLLMPPTPIASVGETDAVLYSNWDGSQRGPLAVVAIIVLHMVPMRPRQQLDKVLRLHALLLCEANWHESTLRVPVSPRTSV